MTNPQDLSKMFNPNQGLRFASNAGALAESEELNEMLLPPSQRGRLPLTRSDYAVREDPLRIQWERVVREFIDSLENKHRGHRVTAPMVYEWATGTSLKELAAAQGTDDGRWRGGAAWGSANIHLRHINGVLKGYFGNSRKTTLAGRTIGKAYDVRPHYRIREHEPLCVALKVEWQEGVLDK